MSWGSPPGGPGGYGPPPGGYGPPPGGYGPPPGGYGPPAGPPMGFPPPGGGGGPIQLANAGALMHREPITVILLSMVTCGIYYFYWLYKVSEELQLALNDPSINPGTDLILSIITCGLWGIYLQHRNTQKIHFALYQADPYRKDQSQMVLVFHLLGAFVVPGLGLAGMWIAQQEHNLLCRAGQGGDPRQHGASTVSF